jgi:hypothetical protein
MSNIPNCNAILNGRNVYLINPFSYILYWIFDLFGLYVFGGLFVLFVTIYAFSKNIVILVFSIIFLILAIRSWYLYKYGRNSVSERPCKNSSGEVLN